MIAMMLLLMMMMMIKTVKQNHDGNNVHISFIFIVVILTFGCW